MLGTSSRGADTLLVQIPDNLPGLLWHYTNAAGLSGILTSGALRFSNAQSVNDETEYRHGRTIVIEQIEREIAKADSLSSVFASVMQHILERRTLEELFICCLSETGDSRYHWRSYGDFGYGYGIGITPHDLLSAGEFTAVWPRPLVYRPTEQRAAVARALDRFRRRTMYIGDPSAGLDHLVLELFRLTLVFKNPKYFRESEWRLILVAPLSYPPLRQRIKTTDRAYAVNSYVDLRAQATDCSRLPIKQIVCGSNLDSTSSRSQVEQLLAMHGYTDVAVSASEIAPIEITA
jgi:hypothetical protein